MSPRKNSSTCFYKRTTNGLLSLFGRSLERIFELEDNVTLANQENTRLHLENAQLRQEISALQTQNNNLVSGREPNTPAEAIHTHPSTSSPETTPDHVNLPGAARRSK
jgi:regulator of replication initiation timing